MSDYTLHGYCDNCGHSRYSHERRNEPYGGRTGRCRYVVSMGYGRTLCECRFFRCGCPTCMRNY